MRVCPKCGTKYEESDIRSMCGNCMVSLVPAPPEGTAQEVPGPIPYTTVYSPSTVMPDITLPDIFTPTTAMPTSSMMPGIEMPDVVAPAGMPTAPTPEAKAAALAEVVRQVTSVQDRAPAPPPVFVAPVPPPPSYTRPAPPKPPLPATNITEGAATFTPGRALTPEEMSSARMQSGAFWITGVIAILIALSALSGGTFFSFLMLALFTLLGTLAIRKAISVAAINSVTLAISGPVALNGDLGVDIRLAVLKELPITEATLELRAIVESVDHKAKNQKQTEVIYSTKVQLEAGTRWAAGKMMTGHTSIHIPTDGIPTFKMSENQVRWELTFAVSIPGWYPDIKKELPVQVLAKRQGITNPPVLPVTFQLSNISDLGVKLTLQASRGASDVPAMAVGKPVKMIVTINPKTQSKANSHLIMELKCNVGAESNWEKLSVATVNCFPQGWQAEQPLSTEVNINLPATVPVSFRSSNIMARWVIELRYTTPWVTERHDTIPVLVIPGDG